MSEDKLDEDNRPLPGALPCPFCGGTKIATYAGSTFRWRYAACTECGAQAEEVRIETIALPRPKAIEAADRELLAAWNTRAPLSECGAFSEPKGNEPLPPDAVAAIRELAEVDRVLADLGVWPCDLLHTNQDGSPAKDKLTRAGTILLHLQRIAVSANGETAEALDLRCQVRILAEGSDWRRDSGERLTDWALRTIAGAIKASRSTRSLSIEAAATELRKTLTSDHYDADRVAEIAEDFANECIARSASGERKA